jgi:hypothetical protein
MNRVVISAFVSVAFSTVLCQTALAADDEIVIVHFGDSTCITSYLPKKQRVESVLNHRLTEFYEDQEIVNHNVAAGGDYIRQFLDSGRYRKSVKDKIPNIDIAMIRYGHNDQKHCEPDEFGEHLNEFCDILKKDYPGVRIILETNTWVDPEHYSSRKAAEQLNTRMNSVWAVVREVAEKRDYPLVEIYERKKKDTEDGNWDQRIRNQQLSMEKFGSRIFDGPKDDEMLGVSNWFLDNHPNANGVTLIADEEFKMITRLWPNKLLVSDPYAGAIGIRKDGVPHLYLRRNEIVKDGAVVGNFDGNQVRRDGSIVGEIRSDVFRHEGVEIWKLDKGNLYEGTEIRLDGSIIGDIRSDGSIYLEGSSWGTIKPYKGTPKETMRALAALYYFSDYFGEEQ